MRALTFAAVALLSTPAFAVPDDPSYPVLPDTPSGAGDPASVTCRAPQALASGAMGPKVCMKNDIWVRLSLTGKDLSADGKSVFERVAIEEPKGNGNPDAVTCRKPVPLTATRVRFGPKVCLTNAQWKSIAEKNMMVTAMGDIVIKHVGPPADGAFPVASVNQGPPL